MCIEFPCINKFVNRNISFGCLLCTTFKYLISLNEHFFYIEVFLYDCTQQVSLTKMIFNNLSVIKYYFFPIWFSFYPICQHDCKTYNVLFCVGCVNIPLREIPSTGVETWYKLEARSQRSSVQGRIRLRLWLSAREAGRHDDDNWQQVRYSRQRKLLL